MQPFLKWPGGKRWISSRIRELIEQSLNGTYHEPFLGGGAVFFDLSPQKARISDLNSELINCYRKVKDNPEDLRNLLKAMPVTCESYYEVRASSPKEPLERAARFLYLNRTAFAGMYRVNRGGQFNVPFGGGERTTHVLYETDVLERASKVLQDTVLTDCDFESTFDPVRAGDVVYCDPTYTVTHNRNGFMRYNERSFAWQDQIRLAESAWLASSRGATVIVSNADHIAVRRLYCGADMMVLPRHSVLSPKVSARRQVTELLVVVQPHVVRCDRTSCAICAPENIFDHLSRGSNDG